MIHVIGHDYISMVFDGYTQNTKATGSGIVYYMIFFLKKTFNIFWNIFICSKTNGNF